MELISILLIVVLVLLILCPYLLKDRRGARGVVVLVLLVAAIGLVIANTRRQTEPKAQPGSDTYQVHQVALARLGEILAEDLADGGKVIVFQMAEASEGIRKYNAAEMAGLKAGAGDAAFDFVVVQPSRGTVPEGGPMGESPVDETITKAMVQHAGAAAVVTCIDLPLGELSPETLPPVYVFDGMGSRFWTNALSEGAVKAVIATREEAPSTQADDTAPDPAAVFEAMFEVKRAAGD